MTIQQIQYIMEVYRTGSISKAADRLMIAQPNLSTAIHAIEQELGVTIFIRHNRGIQVTEQGLRVLEQAGEIQEAYEKMTKVAEHPHVIRVRIGGVFYTPVCEAYNRLCCEYQEEPQLDFSYVSTGVAGALEKVYLSAIDIAICMVTETVLKELAYQAEDKHIVINKIAEVPLVLRIGPKHPLYEEPEIRLDDFRNYTMIDYANRKFTNYPEVRELLNPDRSRMVSIPDRDSKNRLIAQSTMYTVGGKLPDYVNKQYGFRNIPLRNARCTLFAMTRKKERMTPEIKRFLELLREEMEGV